MAGPAARRTPPGVVPLYMGDGDHRPPRLPYRYDLRMTDLTPFANRIGKNFRHWHKWARRRGVSCFRVYDRDIPEFPFALDWYEGRVHLQEFSVPGREEVGAEYGEEIRVVVAAALGIAQEEVILKSRQRQRGLAQYEKLGSHEEEMVVHEGGLRFLVNLTDYLDTGLFLDHRQTRQMVRERSQGRRFLNLFAYTGSFTVYAAAGGARETVTVDLSNTYQEWTLRNLELNGFEMRRHRLERADVFRYLDGARWRRERFDLIVLDPPSFSNSKRMHGVLDVQRDHPRLIEGCLELLNPNGELVFSNNLRRFRLDDVVAQRALVEEITRDTVPEDFRRHRPHQCWVIRAKG